MKDKDLSFDRKKHVIYSKKEKQVVLEHLSRQYSKEEVESIWEKIQLKYVEFLSTLPFLGGKKCTHNQGSGGTYDCILTFAYYEVLDKKPTIDELYEINNEVFLPNFKRLEHIANLNSKRQIRIINKIFEITAKRDQKLENICPTGYVMRVEKYEEGKGINYKFFRCPIAEFAKAHGYTDLMPAFCNSDYPSINYMKGELIRKYTCSNHDFCDYQIVGDKSNLIKEAPTVKDERGYLLNPNKEI